MMLDAAMPVCDAALRSLSIGVRVGLDHPLATEHSVAAIAPSKT
jgi:hypothetical protein